MKPARPLRARYDGGMSAAPIHHKWQEIADLPAELEQFRDPELESLCLVWLDQKNEVEGSQRIEAFNEELRREWAIETGIIEGVYTLDRGVTQTLIRRGIDSSLISRGDTDRDPELVARILRSHEHALEGLFDFVNGGRELNTSYIKELHSALLKDQDTVEVFNQFGTRFETALRKGADKEHPNNPIRPNGSLHEYCPPDHVASEMDRLIEFHREHTRRHVHPLIEAAWLHHAFTQIHPFQDGNGRVARGLASLVLIKGELFPLVVHRDDRERYIEALELADDGSLAELVKLFGRLQKRALTHAIGRAADAKPAGSFDEAVTVTGDLLAGLGKITAGRQIAATQNAAGLVERTRRRLAEAVNKLTGEITRGGSDFRFSLSPLGGTPEQELRSLGEILKYDPNPAGYSAGYAVSLSAPGVDARIVICLHTVGAALRGIIGAIAYFSAGAVPVPLSDDIFRIDYQGVTPQKVQAYTKWLDDALIRGLAEWRKTLV